MYFTEYRYYLEKLNSNISTKIGKLCLLHFIFSKINCFFSRGDIHQTIGSSSLDPINIALTLLHSLSHNSYSCSPP